MIYDSKVIHDFSVQLILWCKINQNKAAVNGGGKAMLYIYLGVGGFLGAVARYALGTLFALANTTAFPWGTWTINLLGSFVLGFFLTLSLERLTISAELRLGIATGFLGAFTTFSTFCVETFLLIEGGKAWLAAAYLLSSLVLGLVSAWFGVILARRLSVSRGKEGSAEAD